MSLEKARRFLMDRLGAGGIVLLAILLDLPTTPDWCHGTDAAGRSVRVLGLGALGMSEEAAKPGVAQGDVQEPAS